MGLGEPTEIGICGFKRTEALVTFQRLANSTQVQLVKYRIDGTINGNISENFMKPVKGRQIKLFILKRMALAD